LATLDQGRNGSIADDGLSHGSGSARVNRFSHATGSGDQRKGSPTGRFQAFIRREGRRVTLQSSGGNACRIANASNIVTILYGGSIQRWARHL
jgi:hypothetical protein